MCGRYTLRTPANLLVKQFGLGGIASIRPRYNIAPTQDVAVVRLGAEPAQRELTFMRWGLVPSWADDPAIGNRMINARAETVAEKPAYRNAFRRRRCLIVADGYYEWQKTGGAKQPHYFHLQDGQPLAFAGLWEIWDKGAASGAVGPLQSCTIITTDASDLTRPIHDRMPVILPPESYASWLDPATDQAALVAMLCPYEKDDLQRHPVSTLVNSPTHDDPRCIECVEVASDDAQPADKKSVETERRLF